jgi:trigger factor
VKTDIEEINATRRVVKVSFEADEVSAEEAELVKQFKRMAKIPGFRPGKAPEAMVRQRYARELREELKKAVVGKAHEEGLEGGELTVFGVVGMDEGEIAAGQAATVSFTIDVIPGFELPEYTGLEVTDAPTDVSEEEVDEVLGRIRNQRAEYNTVERAAETGDYVRCSYEGKIDGTPVAEIVPDAPLYGTQKVTWEEAGATDGPGVEAVVQGLVGMKAGEEKEVTQEFPAGFQPEALAGKTAVYSLKVEEVRQKILPEMDEEFFKSLQVDNEKALRERLRDDIRQRKERENADAGRRQITEKLLQAVELPLPASGLQEETEDMLRDFMQRNLQQGVTMDQLEEHKERLHEGASRAAHDRLKSRIILGRIAEKEKIRVENEDLSRAIIHEAMTSRQKPEKLVKEYKKDRSRLNRLQREILLAKTMDFLVDKAERRTAEPATT